MALLLFSGWSSYGSEAKILFDKANGYYQKQEYDSAAMAYEQLLKSGNEAAAVYYNLGNCYYKSGNIAKSILNYERALKLNPKDEDTDFNLHVAQLKVVDKIQPVPQIFYKQWITTLTALFTPNTWSKIVLGILWITFIFGCIYILSKKPAIRQLSFILILAFIFLTTISLYFAHQSYVSIELDKSAIITAGSVYVKSSPDEKGNDLFILHEGTKVDLLDDYLTWKKIRIPNGSIGWLPSSQLEQI